MKIDSLRLTNFRGFRSLELEFQPDLMVLAGMNGAGKSSVLQALSILLSWMHARVRREGGVGKTFLDLDIRNGQTSCEGGLTLSWNGQRLSWTLAKQSKGHAKQTESDLKSLSKFTADHHGGKLPLAIYYPVNRAALDIPSRIRTRHTFDRFSAYEDALTSGANFRTFFEWFRDREDYENEKKARGEAAQDHQLHAVRTAINAFTGLGNLRIQRRPKLRMTVEKNAAELEIDQLSDGEKCLLALVGDLAQRLATANPDSDAPLRNEAVVMIDEIDLHLHPAWQRKVLPTLVKTFPSCQFILTTHSPAVLSHAQPEQITLFSEGSDGLETFTIDESYGRSSDRVLEDIMGVPARPEAVHKDLARLFEIIGQGNLDEVRKLREALKEDIGDDPELLRADILIRRRELLGK